MCEANHEGSARKMEVDGATEMFPRANEKNGVTYINYVGDGDCKTFKAIVEINPSVHKRVHRSRSEKNGNSALKCSED